MSFAQLNRLSVKLPCFVAAVIVVVAVGLSVVTYVSGRQAAVEQSRLQLQLLMGNRTDGLESWFEAIELTALSIAASPSVAQAMTEFSEGWGQGDAAVQTDIRAAYTTDNRFTAGQRQMLDRAAGEVPYHDVHARHHAYFRYLNETNRFYDVFLADLDGNIVYSVFKESDFGRSLASGPLAESGIGQAYRASVDQPENVAHLSSFDAYGPSNGAVASFASARVTDAAGQLIGVLIIQINIGDFAAVLNDPLGLGDTAETFVVNSDGQLVVDSRFDGGAKASDTIPMTNHVAAALRGEVAELDDAIGLSDPSVVARAQRIVFDNTTYALVAEQAQSEVFADLYAQRNQLILASVLLTAIMSVLACLVIRTITSALDQFGGQMSAIADGDLGLYVSATKRADEIGDMGRILVDFQSKLQAAAGQERDRQQGQIEQQQVLDTLSKGLVDLAQGDLSKPIDQEFALQYDSLRKDFNATLHTLSETISNVVQATGSIQHGANEISQASDDLSNRTENQAATLEQTAAAMDELTASVKSAAEGAKSVETIVIEAQSEAKQSGQIVDDAISAMTEIEKSSAHISQIIGVIDDIAFQTNLLALNAGVEAARAGEAGKGFAVVASEVRALAQRSSEAAKEIKALISGSAKQVERGVDLVGGAGTALGNIVQRVDHISELIRSMATGSAEQAIGLGEINIGINQLDQVTQQNAAMVEEATAASHVLKSDATQLQGLVGQFVIGTTGTKTGFEDRNAAPSAQVHEIAFQPATNVAFDPVPVPVAANGTSGGKSNIAVAQGDWIDF